MAALNRHAAHSPAPFSAEGSVSPAASRCGSPCAIRCAKRLVEPGHREPTPGEAELWQDQRNLASGLAASVLIKDVPNRRLESRTNYFCLRANAFIRTQGNQTKRNGIHVQVLVRDNNVDQALRALKKKMQREGIFREMKMRDYYEKPSEKRAREKAEAVRRVRKLARKRAQREGVVAAPRAAH